MFDIGALSKEKSVFFKYKKRGKKGDLLAEILRFFFLTEVKASHLIDRLITRDDFPGADLKFSYSYIVAWSLLLKVAIPDDFHIPLFLLVLAFSILFSFLYFVRKAFFIPP